MASGPAELESEVQRDPKMRRFYELAREYQRLGRIEEAVVLCEKGLQLNPNQWQARNLLAQIFLAKGRFDEARVQVERVLLALPDNIPANHLAADLYYSLGDKARALRHYQVVDLFDPGRANVAERIQELAAETPAPEETAAESAPAAGEEAPGPPLEEPPAESVPAADGEARESLSPAVSEEPAVEVGLQAEAQTATEPVGAQVFEEVSKPEDWGSEGGQESDLLEVLPSEPTPSVEVAPLSEQAESWADVAPEPESCEREALVENPPGEDTDRVETLQEGDDTQEAPTPPDSPDGLGLSPEPDPSVPGPAFSTVTLAQLYESQGYPEKAVEVYQRILLKEPDNADVRERIRGLKRRMAGEVPEAPAVQEEDVRKAVRQKRIAVLQNWLTRVREASHV
ncbi:MAG: tetratricopeptide repeat protein [Acidobacteriota bacterium]